MQNNQNSGEKMQKGKETNVTFTLIATSCQKVKSKLNENVIKENKENHFYYSKIHNVQQNFFWVFTVKFYFTPPTSRLGLAVL